MREPYGVTIDGVRYVPAREAVANLDDIRTAIEDVFWGEGYKTREQRGQYELWVQVSDDGEGAPLNEFMDELAAKLTRVPLSPNPDLPPPACCDRRVFMKLFAVGWVDITPAEAMEMGLEQAARLRWQMWRIELFGFGMCFRVRPKHQLRDALR